MAREAVAQVRVLAAVEELVAAAPARSGIRVQAVAEPRVALEAVVVPAVAADLAGAAFTAAAGLVAVQVVVRAPAA